MITLMPEQSATDPFALREANQYKNPIASREYLLTILNHAPLSLDELSHQLHYHNKNQQTALKHRLNAMVRDKQLLRNQNNGYQSANPDRLIPGVVIGHPDGFGFLKPDSKDDKLFLSCEQMQTLIHGDHIVARLSEQRYKGHHTAKLVEIKKRTITTLTGQYQQQKGEGWLIPQDTRLPKAIQIAPQQRNHAQAGDMVLGKILKYPDHKKPTTASIIKILGRGGLLSTQIELAIYQFALPHEWPQSVTDEIANINQTLPQSELDKREDLRSLPFVTIDGETACDFDDALYCQPTANGWTLYVAIADVSWYVKPGTALDKQAHQRGVSVYFPQRVIPMLPEILSNQLCSINPGVDRLCLLCTMQIDHHGQLQQAHFSEAVIRSQARLTYNQVQGLLFGQKTKQALLAPLQNLHTLYQALDKARQSRGAISFERVEIGLELNNQGQVIGTNPLPRNTAHRIIEVCMILANTAAASYLTANKVPCLYRVHEGPAKSDLPQLKAFLAARKLSLGGGDSPQPKDYEQLLTKAKNRSDFPVIQTILLRSLKQAIYQVPPGKHFGLALETYTHFTSPIRRYPDLQIHRIIRRLIQGKPHQKDHRTVARLSQIAEHCSIVERRADEASWEVIESLKCHYLSQRAQSVFDGIIEGVSHFGLFVALDDLAICGLVHIRTLGNDYFHYDQIQQRLVGERTNHPFNLGDKITVRMTQVDVASRKITLEPVALPKSLTRQARRKTRKAKLKP